MKNVLRGLLFACLLSFFPIVAEAQTQLIVELLDLTKTEYTIPEEGGFHFENGFLIVDDEGAANHSISIFTIRKISLQAQDTTGQEEPEEVEFSIYPNPTGDHLTINTGSDDELLFSIYSSDGSLCLQGSCRTGDSLDVSTLSSGFYFLSTNNRSLKFYKL